MFVCFILVRTGIDDYTVNSDELYLFVLFVCFILVRTGIDDYTVNSDELYLFVLLCLFVLFLFVQVLTIILLILMNCIFLFFFVCFILVRTGIDDYTVNSDELYLFVLFTV